MTDEKDLEQSENQPLENPDENVEESSPEEIPDGSDAESIGDDAAAGEASAASGTVQDDIEAAVAEARAAKESAEENAIDEPPADEPADGAVDNIGEKGIDENAMMAMLDELPEETPGATPADINFGTGKVSQAEFQHLSEQAEKSEPRNIDILMDVNLPVSIELGHTKMSISDILSLGPGSVVELSKLAGEPVDVLVNNKAVAKGEVVVVDENFGVRITQLMTPEERLHRIANEQ